MGTPCVTLSVQCVAVGCHSRVTARNEFCKRDLQDVRRWCDEVRGERREVGRDDEEGDAEIEGADVDDTALLVESFQWAFAGLLFDDRRAGVLRLLHEEVLLSGREGGCDVDDPRRVLGDPETEVLVERRGAGIVVDPDAIAGIGEEACRAGDRVFTMRDDDDLVGGGDDPSRRTELRRDHVARVERRIRRPLQALQPVAR